MNTPQEVCYALLRGFVPRKAIMNLMLDEAFLNDVEASLHAVGLELVDDRLCDYYGVRYITGLSSIDDCFKDWPSNAPRGLTVTAKAVLVLLWGLLVAPKLAEDPPEREPTVTFEQIYQGYKEQGLSKQGLKTVLTRLKNLKFIEQRKGTYRAAPGMYIYLDSEQMYREMAQSVIRHKIAKLLGEDEESHDKV